MIKYKYAVMHVLSSFQYYQQFQSLHTHMCVYSKISYKFEGIVPGYMEYGDNVFTFVLACVSVCQAYDVSQGQIETQYTIGKFSAKTVQNFPS